MDYQDLRMLSKAKQPQREKNPKLRCINQLPDGAKKTALMMELLKSCDNTDSHCQSEVQSDECNTRKMTLAEHESYPKLDSIPESNANTPSKPNELL